MLDVIVLIAMAVTAAAFAAGLTLQAGLPLLPVLIGTAALFLVMASSFFSMGRGSSGGGASGDRLAELEEALEIIDGDLERLDRVEDGLSRLDGLSERVERLDQAVAGGALSEGGGAEANAAFSNELERVYARIDTLRAEVKAENETQRDEIASDISALDGLIKRITGDLAAATAAAGATQAFVSKSDVSKSELSKPEVSESGVSESDEPPPLPVAEGSVTEDIVKEDVVIEPEPEQKPLSAFGSEPAREPEAEPTPEAVPAEEPEPEIEILTVEEVVETAAPEAEPEAPAEPKNEPETPAELKDEPKEDSTVEPISVVAEPEPEPETTAGIPASAVLDDDEAEEKMLGILREGISEGRVDLYLQPTVILPDRKVGYFEAMTRIRAADDEIVLPGDYIPVAKRAALMPLIDNVLLVRSVQVLRRLGPDTRIKGVFGNVSMHSLLDPDYYPELIEFMEENSSLSENLVFQINQAEMGGLTKSELACLDTLGALGFTFCLDNVADIDTNFSDLSDRYFRHVKVSAASFLGGPGRKVADLKRRLEGLGIQLIIEKVENEGDVAELLDHGIELAQGHLFGDPGPMNVVLSKELEGAGSS
jgi:cyclic-di-GMP phosphodiesterase TipF (flagellum assembly factor)